jgi:Ca2+/H+ antiporter, TMEM165/GDT1 family
MTALLSSFVLVTLAEMADKTQLLTLCLTCRYPVRKVFLGIAIAIALLNLAAVAVGGAVGEYLPVTPVKVAAGIMFIAFGLWNLRPRAPTQEDEESTTTLQTRSAVLAVAGAFFIAELGDKTQLATLSLSARFGAYATVWLGATAGMLLANSLAIAGGAMLGTRLSQSTLMRVSGVLFVGFGIWTLIDALL